MPGIAPWSMAWRRRMANVAGPMRASGEASNGEPVQVEMLVNGVWTDLTAGSWVMVRDDSGKIDITAGIQGGEGSQTERARATLQLKNTDARFTRRNPTGPYYGTIGRNTPFRINVPDGNGGKSYRIWGEAASWEDGWDSTGSDVWVDLTVAGLLQRLAQGPTPEHSVIYTALTTPLPSSTVAYWPMEDATSATTLASALASGSPMTWTGTPTLADYSDFPSSDPVPSLQSTILTGGVARYDDPTAIQVRFLCHIPAAGLTNGTVICSIDQADDGGPQLFDLYYGNFTGTSKGVTFHAMLSDGTDVGADLENTYDIRGKRLYVSIEMQESGTSVTRAVRIYDLDAGVSYDTTDTVVSAHLNRVTRVRFGPASISAASPHGTTGLSGCAIGHATVENTITSNTILGVRLNPIGEKAGRRIQRLCGESGIPFEWIGDLDDTAALGAQGKQNMLSLVQEAVLADGGLLYETRDVLGLGYRTRASLYNQDPALVLSYTGFNHAEVPVPVEDDRLTQNKVTVTVNGVSASYEETTGRLSTQVPPAGVGVYGPQDLTLNLATTDTPTLRDQAAWRVHLGTVDEDRYPSISVNLAHPSITPQLKRAILALRIGDRAQFTGMPAWVAPDTPDQLILGTAETINHFQHRLTFTCAPASPYTVGVLDADAARIDTDSSLLAAITSSATTLMVVAQATDGPLWTTADADAPWTVRIGGETMTATANTSSVYDTFTRTVANGWGTANSGQSWTVVGTAADYAVGSGYGSATLPATGIAHITTITAPSADVDLYCDVATSALATGASLLGGPCARFQDNNNHYMGRLEFTTGAAIILTLRKRVGGTETSLMAYTTDITHVAGTFYRVRLQVYGAALKAKVWDAATVEPPAWMVTATDTELKSAANVATRCFSNTGNTNVNPQVRFDQFDLRNVQTFTVTRSVNGVVKAHSAGETVSLATPIPLAL